MTLTLFSALFSVIYNHEKTVEFFGIFFWNFFFKCHLYSRKNSGIFLKTKDLVGRLNAGKGTF